MSKDEELIERAANIAYRVCAETRHVTLGDKAANAIRAELRPADRLKALAQPVVGVEGRAAHEYATELREIAGMLAQAPDGPIRWKQYRLAEIADWITALAATPSPVVGDREAIADSLKHCKALILSTGREIPVADGKITLPGDLTDIERTELLGILSFFTPVVGGEEELERLRSLCKANNDLARMYGADRKRLMAENTRLKDAIEYAHSQGFDWPFDPLADPHTTDRAGMAQEVE